MASEDLYDELQVGGEQDDLYEDLNIPANGHPPQVFRQNLPPQLPPSRVDPRAKTLPNKSVGPPPSIPTRAPTTSLTGGGTIRTLPSQQTKSPKKKDKKMESPPKKNPKSPPPAGGIDMNEILKRRQQMNSRALEDLDKSRQQQQEADTEDKHVAPWLNQLKKTNRTSAENNDEPKEEEVPEFIRKRRSMSLMSEEDESVTKIDKPTPKPRSVTSISSEPDKPPPAPKPKPAAKPPKPAVAEKPNKPPPISPKPSSEGSPKSIPKPKARTSVNSEPPSYPAPSIPPPRVPLEDEPSYTQPTITSKIKLPPPVPEEEVPPPPPPKTHPPPSVPPSQRTAPSSDSEEERPPTPPRTCPPPSLSQQKPNVPPHVPNMKAPPFPPKMRPPPSGPPSPPRTKAPPPLPNQEVATSEESQPMPYPPRSVPPKAGELTLPQSSPPLVDRPPSIIPKRPAPLPPTLSPATHGEPTPTTTVLRYRRLPLPPVDINNPPPLPSRDAKQLLLSSIPPHRSPPLIPTESMVEEEEEDIYDDTAAVSSPPNASEVDDQELYDDITGISIAPPPPSSTLPSIPPPSQNALPPKLPDPPPPLSTLPSIPPIPQRGPPVFAVPPPPVPVLEESEEYDEPPKDLPNSPGHNIIEQENDDDKLYDDCAFESNQLPVESSSLPRSPVSRSSLALPPPPDTEVSPRTSPTLGHKKGLTKEEKRLIKEEEKKQKEQKKLELQREKERKKKEEIKMKNRQKSIKQFKEFKLPDILQPLYAVEITEERKGSKDHMAVSKGEKLSVILIRHDKLHESKFLVEKDDGTLGLVDRAITFRTIYESAQPLDLQSPAPEDFGYGYEDLYEAVDIEITDGPPPALPGHPPPSRHLSPPIPTEDDEEPQDVYEYLPECDD